MNSFSISAEDVGEETMLKMSCYTFNGKVSCSPTSIKTEHAKGNAVVKVGENNALKDAVVVGPTVKLVPWQRIHNLQTEIRKDGAKLRMLASNRGPISWQQPECN
jgi:hypothetical protein